MILSGVMGIRHFGTEPNKDLTLHFVNAMLQGREVIKSLRLSPEDVKRLSEK